jgi:hypothetical protein
MITSLVTLLNTYLLITIKLNDSNRHYTVFINRCTTTQKVGLWHSFISNVCLPNKGPLFLVLLQGEQKNNWHENKLPSIHLQTYLISDIYYRQHLNVNRFEMNNDKYEK